MKGARAFIVALICIIFLRVSLNAVAQGLPGIVGTSSALAAVGIADPVSAGKTSDVFFGNDTRGGYTLSWKPVEQFSEYVTVDNRSMQRVLDYEIDYASGVISFAQPISNKGVISVRYSYDPSTATRNSTALNVPLSLDLLKRGSLGLQLTGLYRMGDTNSSSALDMTVLGLSGESKVGSADISTMLLFSPERSSSDGQYASSFDDRSVLKFGGTTQSDLFELKTSYLRVGEEFAGAKEYKLQQGTEAIDIAAALSPTDRLKFSSSLKRFENFSGEKQGEIDSAMSHSITFSPERAPRLMASHSEVEKARPGSAESRTTTDQVQLDHAFNPRLSVTASHESIAKEVGDIETRSTANTFGVEARPADNLRVRSTLALLNSTTDGEQTNIGLNLEATPTSMLSVKAAMSHTDAEKTGEQNVESLNLAVNPNRRLNIELKMTHKDADLSGSEFQHALTVVSRPSSDLQVELGLAGRAAELSDDEAAHSVKVSSTAVENTSVHVDWAEKESDSGASEEVSRVRVVTSPMDNVMISGALGYKDTGESRELNKEARVEINPLPNTKLASAYKEVEADGIVKSRVKEFSASTRPADFMELSGNYKLREALGQEDLESVNVALLLDTGRVFSLTGAYIVNPEDKNGVVQRMNSHSIGMKSDLGRVGLKGSYTLKDEYLAGRRREAKEVGLDYRLSSESQITTSYSVEENADASILETSAYALGFSHKVGSDFNIYLGGRMTTYEKEQVPLTDQTEYQAEARLGVKF